MKKFAILCLTLLASLGIASAQVSGGAGAYGSSNRSATEPARVERAKREIAGEREKGDTSTLIDAAILMNVKADQYVAVFAIAAEGETPQLAGRALDETLATFSGELDKLGVLPADRAVDFIAQSRVYGFEEARPPEADGDVTLVEVLTGFETRKNVSVRFRDIARVEALVAAAARAGIYDLVKVDYIVNDAARIQEQLQLQTMNLIRQKTARYNAAFGTKLDNPTQIVADVPSVYFPVNQYDSYVAAEAEKVGLPFNRSRATVISARKTRSTYFSPLSGDGFDAVINPIIVEPVVQFTTYIKVRFAPPKK